MVASRSCISIAVAGDRAAAVASRNTERALHLKVPGVAITVMTNYGFHAAMAEAGVEVATTQVGDRPARHDERGVRAVALRAPSSACSSMLRIRMR